MGQRVRAMYGGGISERDHWRHDMSMTVLAAPDCAYYTQKLTAVHEAWAMCGKGEAIMTR
jgi:hypothetical protein